MSSCKAINLVVMVRVDNLRGIWLNEARDFNPWLTQNQKLLGDAVGIGLVLEAKQVAVGAFSADILVMEEESNRIIIIESQLDAAEHGRLGKVISYSVGKSVDVLIWVVKRAREDYRQAIKWLNQRTVNSLGFFQLKSAQNYHDSPLMYIRWGKDLFATLKNDTEAIELEMWCKMMWNENIR